MPDIRTVNVTRYIAPFREGGSLPALAEADDDFKYVLKFRGSGQGPKALIAELIGGEIARLLGLKIPELVFARLDEVFGQTEPDEEIQDLLKASLGLNLGLHFLSGALAFDSVAMEVSAEDASRIVWFDAFITNVDRTYNNVNLLAWHQELWLIDHGAAMYFHHSWTNWEAQAKSPFPLIKDHVLLSKASLLAETNAEFRQLLTEEKIRDIVALIPDAWLQWPDTEESPAALREVYARYLTTRLEHSDIFTKKAQDEKDALV